MDTGLCNPHPHRTFADLHPAMGFQIRFRDGTSGYFVPVGMGFFVERIHYSALHLSKPNYHSKTSTGLVTRVVKYPS